jgi:hypothetical protein
MAFTPATAHQGARLSTLVDRYSWDESLKALKKPARDFVKAAKFRACNADKRAFPPLQPPVYR